VRGSQVTVDVEAARGVRQNRPMPDGFARFHTVVFAEPALEQRLRALDDWDAFAAEAVRTAGEHGIALTVDELEAERRHAQLGWLARWA
jgi:hypothetical protein